MQLSKSKFWIVGALAIGAVVLAWVPSLADQNTWVVRSSDDDRAYLGVTLEEELDYDEGGARITRVVDGSPADLAGLEDGDIIVSFDGQTIRGPVGLSRSISDAEPGAKIKLRYVRDGRESSAEVELISRDEMRTDNFVWSSGDGQDWEEFGEQWAEWGERFGEQWAEWGERFGEEFGEDFAERFSGSWFDEDGNATFFGPHSQGLTFDCDDEDCDGQNLSFFVSTDRPRLGVHLVETTAELREHLGGDRDAGVLVSRIVEDSTAEEAGIEVGDLILSVDGDSVSSSGELRRALRDVAGKSVDIVVSRDGRRVTLSAEFPEEDEDGLFGPRASLIRVPTAVMPDRMPIAPAPPAPPVPSIAVIPQGLAAVPAPDVRVAPVVVPAPAPLAPLSPRIRIRGVDRLGDSVRELRDVRREQRVVAAESPRTVRELRQRVREGQRGELRRLQREIRRQRSTVL